MYWWIYNGQIAGTSNTLLPPEQWATGFRLVSALPGLEPENCYWDAETEEIKPKPDRPTPQHFWNPETNEWMLPAPLPIATLPHWKQLEDQLRGSILFQKGYAAAERTLKANAAFTLLTNALTTTHNLNDLRFAFARLREALEGIAAIGDFTAEELETIAEKLIACHFDPTQFGLE